MKLTVFVILSILSISISVGKCDRTNNGQFFKKTTLQPFSYTFGMQKYRFSIHFHIQIRDNVATSLRICLTLFLGMFLKVPLLGKMPDLQKQKIENMSIFFASWIMVSIDNSSFYVIKHCAFNVY